MPPVSTATRALEGSVRRALERVPSVVLAVSGGVDSMVLLHAAARARRDRLWVATFDHGTGRHAEAAAQLVAAAAAALGMTCVVGHATLRGTREHEWREERWRFLREIASKVEGTIVTAHTLDDQIETVFIRALRQAGPRGLAGLYAPSSVLRPLVDLPREAIHRYAAERGIRFVEDPSNYSRAHLRNRVRLDLLPRITAIRPSFGEELLHLAHRAARWRAGMERLVNVLEHEVRPDGSLCVSRRALLVHNRAALQVLWPALAGRIGVAMDWRGTHRVAEFTIKGAHGRAIQLSGGVEVVRDGEQLVLRRWRV